MVQHRAQGACEKRWGRRDEEHTHRCTHSSHCSTNLCTRKLMLMDDRRPCMPSHEHTLQYLQYMRGEGVVSIIIIKKGG